MINKLHREHRSSISSARTMAQTLRVQQEDFGACARDAVYLSGPTQEQY
jgi:hypothetical protein